MTIVSLNVWGGKMMPELETFLRKQSEATDVFCFQEVFSAPPTVRHETHGQYRIDLFAQLTQILPRHTGYFFSALDGFGMEGKVDFPLSYGPALFLRKNMNVETVGDYFIHKTKNDLPNPLPVPFYDKAPRTMAYCRIRSGEKCVTIANVHGLHTKTVPDNTDCPERIAQSRCILNFLNHIPQHIVLCGDFNESMDTRSIGMLEEKLVNLCRKHGVTSTRNTVVKEYRKRDLVSDYIFVSPDCRVRSFSVLPDQVSDHLPLVLQLDIPVI